MSDFAVMYPIGTDSPQEAARFWREKKEREDQEATEATREAEERRAKVVRGPGRKGPRTTEGIETK